MTQATGSTFICPGCGKQYTWKPELQGKKVRCKCGHEFTVDGGEAATESPEPERPVGGVPFVNGVAVKVRAPIAETSTAEESALRGIYIPAALLVTGIALQWVAAYSAKSWPLGSASVALAMGAFESIIRAAIVLVMMYGIATFFRTDFGNLPRAVLKVVAIAVLGGAVGTLVARIDPMPGMGRGRLVAAHVVTLLNCVCLYSLFELDVQETLWIGASITLAQIIATLATFLAI